MARNSSLLKTERPGRWSLEYPNYGWLTFELDEDRVEIRQGAECVSIPAHEMYALANAVGDRVAEMEREAFAATPTAAFRQMLENQHYTGPFRIKLPWSDEFRLIPEGKNQRTGRYNSVKMRYPNGRTETTYDRLTGKAKGTRKVYLTADLGTVYEPEGWTPPVDGESE